MALEVKPKQATFNSLDDYGECELELINKSSETMQYKFRLPTSAIVVKHPQNKLIDAGQRLTVQVQYHPGKNDNRQALLAMQLVSQQLKDGKPQESESTIISVTFKENEDDFFSTPKHSEVFRAEKKWWQ